MKAMILAAGRGERLRPLTDTCPKPLLEVCGKPLIVWHLLRLAAAGITEVVINHAWLGEQIEATLGDGQAFGVSLRYSAEGEARETAGGIALALPLLGEQPFLLLSADIYTDYDFSQLVERAQAMPAEQTAHLVMVSNPPYHPQGDFALIDGWIAPDAQPKLCYANIAICRPSLVAGVAPGSVAKLGPLLAAQAKLGRVSGERFDGRWVNVGTVADLDEARSFFLKGFAASNRKLAPLTSCRSI